MFHDPFLEYANFLCCHGLFRSGWDFLTSRGRYGRGLPNRKCFDRVRLWITSLRPYPSLALFAVPVILLEPAKPISGYLIGTGHFFAGAVVFITAEVLKLTVVERLFHLNKRKLLSIPAFAWGYGYWRQMMDAVQSLEAWKVARRLAAKAKSLLRTHWQQLRNGRWFRLLTRCGHRQPAQQS